jgi:putative membrane protein
MEERKTTDSKYVQQHLANERTFLAWVRTAITIAGLGFLAAGVVFRETTYEHLGHKIAAVVGIGAVLFGGIILCMATVDFRTKQKGINKEAFRSPTTIIWLVFLGLALIQIFMIFLVVVLLLY